MELLYLLLLISLFALFIYFSFLLLSYQSESRSSGGLPLPPGNTGWPLIGETLEFLSTGWKGHPENFIFDRLAKYSSDVFKTSLVGQPAAVFCGAACNKFLFSNENKLVQVWWPDSINKIFPSSTQTSTTEEAIKMRKMLPNFLKPEALQRYVGIMHQIATKHFEFDWENKTQVLVFPLTRTYTFWIACKVFLSIEEPTQVAKLLEPFRAIGSGIISVPLNVPGTPYNRAIKSSKLIREQLVGIIKQRKLDLGEGKASPTQDILSHMLLTSDENGKFMSEGDIADKILALLIGGYDTASSACTSIVMFLAESPIIYERVYKEQMEILKSKDEGESLNWEDIQKMKYSWNVACEVLRLAPPLQGSFREALTNFTYNGYSIPKGWKLYWSANSTHKSPEIFPEPMKFDPSRFEGAGPQPYTFVPFGGGPRMCPGKEYARLEILVFMHHIVTRFRWEKIFPDEKFVVSPMPIPAKQLPVRLFPHVT